MANDVVAGGQVGCDYQAGEFVFGVQGMGDWTQMKGRFFDAVTGQFQETAQARWFATATGRIGYTITPPTLIYVTAPPGSATNTRTLLTLRLVALSPAASALVATRLTVPPALPNLAGLSA